MPFFSFSSSVNSNLDSIFPALVVAFTVDDDKDEVDNEQLEDETTLLDALLAFAFAFALVLVLALATVAETFAFLEERKGTKLSNPSSSIDESSS